LAVAVRYFDPPPFPDGHVILLQVMDDLKGLNPGRRVVGQKLRCFEAIKSVTVAEGKVVEGHGQTITCRRPWFRRVADTGTT
jgi:hypothetical protein